MKALFLIFLSTLLLPEQGEAQNNHVDPYPDMHLQQRLPSAVKVTPKGTCEKVAWDVAAYVDGAGWGRDHGEQPRTVNHTNEDHRYTYEVKMQNAKGESVSGYTYMVDLTLGDSGSCFVTNVSTDGTDQGE
ncbi:MAG: hypothetical protein ACXVB9_08620 [Bdellovibrionota bacterium]